MGQVPYLLYMIICNAEIRTDVTAYCQVICLAFMFDFLSVFLHINFIDGFKGSYMWRLSLKGDKCLVD